MNISSHCTIGKHAYGTCLNGYAHFSSLFLCAIRKANYEKCNIYHVSMFCYIKTSFVGSKIAVMLLCKHDECEHKKRLNFFIHKTKYLLPSVILYLNAEVGGLSIRLKIKKKKISK